MKRAFPQNVQLLVACLAIALIMGCSADSPEVEPPSISEVSQNGLKAALVEAQSADNVSQAQIDLLSQPEITFAAYEQAMNAFFACVESQGLTVQKLGSIRESGVEMINFTVTSKDDQHSPEAAEVIQDDCYDKEAIFVDRFWQGSSPDALAWQEDFKIEMVQVLSDCLKEQGVEVPADASFDELAKIDLERDLVDADYCFARANRG